VEYGGVKFLIGGEGVVLFGGPGGDFVVGHFVDAGSEVCQAYGKKMGFGFEHGPLSVGPTYVISLGKLAKFAAVVHGNGGDLDHDAQRSYENKGDTTEQGNPRGMKNEKSQRDKQQRKLSAEIAGSPAAITVKTIGGGM